MKHGTKPSTVFLWTGCFLTGLGGCLLLSGCGSEEGPITSKSTNYQVADQTEGAADQGQPNLSPAREAGMSADAGRQGATGVQPIGSRVDGSASRGQPGDTVASARPSTMPAGGFNPYQAQGDTPEELLAFIREMAARQPQGTTQAEQLSDYQNVQNAIIGAADKILGQSADTETLAAASEAKLTSLSFLSRLGVSSAGQRLQDFCDELSKHEDQKLAGLGRSIAFANRMDEFAKGESDDAQTLLIEFKELFAGLDKDARSLELGRQMSTLFEQANFDDEALETLKLVTMAFTGNDNAALAEAAAQMSEQVRLMELGIREKLTAFLDGEPDSFPPLLEGLDALLAGDQLGASTLSVTRQIAQYVESIRPDVASDIYTRIAEAFQGHADPQLVSSAQTIVDMYQRRSSIVGQPFTLEGGTLDGKPFDWTRYSGKVVLIDFWATWCGPCLEELPNITKNYELYHDKGFEVIGVNLDDDCQQVAQFLSFQPLPWTTVVNSDANARGFDHPSALKCGVEAIPFLVLVDRDGTAIARNVRGEALGEKLAELFGTPAASGSAPPAAP